MEKLRLRSNEKINRIGLEYKRDEIQFLEDAPRLAGIKGSRGVGKTTLLLQHLKATYGLDERAIYLSLDDIYFTDNKLIETVSDYYRNGLQALYLDEVHKYPDWSIEVKNLFDTYPDLKIFFTGSSMLEIQRSNADLSRRAVVFPLQGLSFRQYLGLRYDLDFRVYDLEEILRQPNQVIASFPEGFRPYSYFSQYLKEGYYPFFMDGSQWYFDWLENTVKTVIEADLPLVKGIEVSTIRKIFVLLYVLATSPPFKPNISKLSERIGISRTALLQYIELLDQAGILFALNSHRRGLTALQKPSKIFLENSNLIYTYNPDNPNLGTIRETFVVNQLKAKHEVHYPDVGDLLVDHKYVLEIGGRSKKRKQIAGMNDAFLVADKLDYAVGLKIPIYLFGFLY